MTNPTILQEDSPKVLQNGTGTPYLAICNGSTNSPIMDTQNNLPIGMLMSTFNYDYDEEDDDSGEFTLETDNPELAASSELDYFAPLKLQWGWIYSSNKAFCGPVRKVLVIGKEVVFNESGTKIRIKFASASILLKRQSGSKSVDYTLGWIQAIHDVLSGCIVGVSLLDYTGEKVVTERKMARIVETAEEVENKYEPSETAKSPYSGDNTYIPTPYLSLQPTSRTYGECVGVKIYEWDGESEELVNNLEEYTSVWLKEKKAQGVLLQGLYSSRYQQLCSMTKMLKNGPYFIDGRDDNIFIHNAAVNRPLSKTYTYAGGNWELLEFTVTSNYVESSVSVFETSDIDDNKDVSGQTVESENALTTKLEGDNIYYMNLLRGLENPSQQKMPRESKPSPVIPDWWPDTSIDQPDVPNTVQDPEEPYGSYNEAKEKEAAKEKANDFEGYSPEQAQEYLKKLATNFDNFMEAPSVEVNDTNDLASVIDTAFTIGNDHYKKRVQVKQRINATVFAYMSDTTPEEFMDGLQSGKYDILNYDFYAYAANRPTQIGFGKDYKTGLEYLRQLGGIVEIKELPIERIDMNPPLPNYPQVAALGNMVEVTYETEVEIPILGTRILSTFTPNFDDPSMPSLLEDHLDHQMEARATIVGDPTLESSMNLLIQNVSSLYSGIWYIKKISHRMSASIGYKCEIEFVARNVDKVISTVNVKSSLPDIWEKMVKEPAKKWVNRGYDPEDELILYKTKVQNHKVSEVESILQQGDSVVITADGENPTNSLRYDAIEGAQNVLFVDNPDGSSAPNDIFDINPVVDNQKNK